MLMRRLRPMLLRRAAIQTKIWQTPGLSDLFIPGTEKRAIGLAHGKTNPRGGDPPDHALGRRIVKVEPTPNSLVTVSVPPSAVMIDREIASPRPLPPESRERARSTR